MTVNSYKTHSPTAKVFQQLQQESTDNEQKQQTYRSDDSTIAMCNSNKTITQLKETQQSNHPAIKSSHRVNEQVHS